MDYKKILIKIMEKISIAWHDQPIKIIDLKFIPDALIYDDFNGVDTIKFTYKHVGKKEIHEHTEILEDDYLDDCRAWLWEMFLDEIVKEQEGE